MGWRLHLRWKSRQLTQILLHLRRRGDGKMIMNDE
jgi:hypothetical protein